MIWGKIPRLGAYSPLSTSKERGSSNQVPMRGQAPPSMAEVSKVAGSKNPSGRTAEPPLEVLPIYVRSPSTQNAKLPPTMSEDEGRDCLGIEGDENWLLTNSELTAGVVLSILRDSDLKRADALSVEEALADKTLPRPYLNSCLEDPAGHFNGLLETDLSNRRNPRSKPSLSITGLLV